MYKNKDILVIDFLFVNGDTITDCVIFKTGEKGEESIQDLEYISKLLAGNIPERYIYFQNNYMNGKFHINNLLNYNIRIDKA